MAARVRLELKNGKTIFTKSLIVKSVELLLQDTAYKVSMSKKQLIEWFGKNIHISLRANYNNGSIYTLKTDTDRYVDVSYRKPLGFLSTDNPNESISELELIFLFKQALTTASVVSLNKDLDEFESH